MIQTGVAGADKLCFALLKQLPGKRDPFVLLGPFVLLSDHSLLCNSSPAGSTNSGDIYIVETLMHILLDNRWVRLFLLITIHVNHNGEATAAASRLGHKG